MKNQVWKWIGLPLLGTAIAAVWSGFFLPFLGGAIASIFGITVAVVTLSYLQQYVSRSRSVRILICMAEGISAGLGVSLIVSLLR